MIILAVKILLYFISTLALGYFFLWIFFKIQQIGKLEFLVLSFGAGTLLTSFQLFIALFLLKYDFSFIYFAVLFITEIAAMAIFAFFNSRNEPSSNEIPKKILGLDIMEGLVLFLIILQFIIVITLAFSRPTMSYDSVANWSLRAKILYYSGQVNFNPGEFTYLVNKWHDNYPWLVSLNLFWFSEVIGRYDDALYNLIFVFYYFCIASLIYCWVKKFTSRFNSLLMVFIYVSMQLPLYHAYNAYADLPLSFYALASLYLFFAWIENQEMKYLALAGFISGIAFFVKLEGIIIIASLFACLLTYLLTANNRNKLKIFLIFMLCSLLPVLPWLYFNAIYGLGLSNVAPGLGFHPEIFKNFMLSLFVANNWNIFWYLAITTFIYNFKKIFNDKSLLAGWLFIIFGLLALIILYLFTNQYQFVINNTAVSRNILLFIPVAVVMSGITIFKKYSQEPEKASSA